MSNTNRCSLKDILSKPFQTQYEHSLKFAKNLEKQLSEKNSMMSGDDWADALEKALFENYDFETIETDVLEKNVMTLFLTMNRHCKGKDEYLLSSWYAQCMNIIEKKKIKKIFELTNQENFKELYNFFQSKDFQAFRERIPDESELKRFEKTRELKTWLEENSNLLANLSDQDLKKAIDDLNSPLFDIEKKIARKLGLPDLDENLIILFSIMDIQSETPEKDYSDIIAMMKEMKTQTDIENLKRALLNQEKLLLELVERHPENSFLLTIKISHDLQSKHVFISALNLEELVKDIESIKSCVASALTRPQKPDQRKALLLLNDYLEKNKTADIIIGFSDFLSETPEIKKIYDVSITNSIMKFFVRLYMLIFGDSAIKALKSQLERFYKLSVKTELNKNPKDSGKIELNIKPKV